LSSGSWKLIKIWNLISGECIKTLKGHTDWVKTLAVLSDNKLASGSDDKTIKIWI
jgi:WD40 repeat protein